MCFSSWPSAGKRSIGDLFRYLLSPEHEPLAFDLDDNVNRLHVTNHMSDVFAGAGHDILSKQIAEFIGKADGYDNALIDRFECLPAPETQLTFLKEGSH